MNAVLYSKNVLVRPWLMRRMHEDTSVPSDQGAGEAPTIIPVPDAETHQQLPWEEELTHNEEKAHNDTNEYT